MVLLLHDAPVSLSEMYVTLYHVYVFHKRMGLNFSFNPKSEAWKGRGTQHNTLTYSFLQSPKSPLKSHMVSLGLLHVSFGDMA